MSRALPTYADVEAAARRIAPHVHRTPVLHSTELSRRLGLRVDFKCENFQKAGAFKATAELMNVKGIGEKNFNKIQSYLTVGDGAARPASGR